MTKETGDSFEENKDTLKLVKLINKEMREGLSTEEMDEKAFLVRLRKSGK